MKKNKLLFGIATAVTLLLLIPALIVPTMGASATLAETVYDFDDLTPGMTPAQIRNALGGDSAHDWPSTTTVQPNPTGDGSDYVLHVESKVFTSNQGDVNVDKNMMVGNAEMSYEKYDKIVLQTEYYIEANSKGSLESQFKNYTSTTHSAESWLTLFKIDLGSGMLTTSFGLKDGKTGSYTLEKEVWNTVSLVIDLDTGAIDYYVNNVLFMQGYLTRDDTVLEGLILNPDRWIIAKPNKQSSDDLFAGGFYINNARYHGYSESMKVTPVDNGNLLYTDVTLSSGREVSAGPGDTILVNSGVSYEVVSLDDYQGALAPVKGASIRLTNTTGIRFATQIDTDKLDELLALKEAGKIRSIQIGTLITPYTYVTEAGAFTFDALSKLSYSAKYLDVKANIGAYYNPGVTLDEGYDTCFVGSIIDIKPGNRTRLFTGVGYIKVTMNNGASKYVYSYDYTDAATQEQNYSRSIQYIASVFVNDSRFTAYRELLQSFMEGLTVATGYSTTYVQNVQYSYSEFYFQNAAGVACQLLYDGNNGWRLQAVNPTQTNNKYNEFSNTGAAQALSNYLGEEYDDKAMRLSVTQDSSKFTIRAEGTDSYVTLNITGSFNLQFFSPNGVLMNNVNSITANGTNVTLTGKLNDGEAVYGGGETFNAVNKRGQYMSLYSYDAYNSGLSKEDYSKSSYKNEAGTYTVIPLFTFTRGSGMFINRYEIMYADWGNASNGNTSSDVWEVSIENNLIDCYFYATGNMLDAIYGYTDLAGHATLPEEWAQGTLICRYSPDFASLEGETMIFDSLEDIPDYEKLTLSKGGALATTVTDWLAQEDGTYTYSGQLLYSGSTAKYRYVVTDGVGQFYRCTKKGGAPMGAGVQEIVEGLIEAGMKPTAMVLEGLSWSNLGTSSTRYNNFVKVIEYCESLGINTTVYMAVGNISTGMPGYREEYQLSANVTYNVTLESGKTETTYSGSNKVITTYTHDFASGTKTTIEIPKNAASDNPDAVGSGTMSYLDITNPDAVDWYMDVVWGQLIEIGVDGVKIDFCEIMPNEGFTFDITGTKTVETIKSYGYGASTTKSTTVSVGTATLEYQWYDPTVFEGDDVHHAYSSYFISLFYQRMNEKAPEGFVVLNRGGGIGMQRNPYMWAGDQTRSEATLKTQLRAVLSSGISGLPFMTYDMAGYAYGENGVEGYWNGNYTDPEAGAAEAQALESEIFTRAIQYTAFSLMIQTHGDVRHLYDMTEEAQQIAAQYNTLHEELIPYIQKYSKVACDTGMPVMRLLVLHHQNDANVYDISDQYMFGDGLMVAPILTLNTTERSVYLPEGTWVDLLTGEEYVITQDTPVEERWITVTAQINQIPVFLNADSADAYSLAKIFNGDIWQSINGGVEIPSFEPEREPPVPEDPTQDDIFFNK